MPTHQSREHRESRVRDFTLYVSISLAVGLVAVILGRSSISLKAADQWLPTSVLWPLLSLLSVR